MHLRINHRLESALRKKKLLNVNEIKYWTFYRELQSQQRQKKNRKRIQHNTEDQGVCFCHITSVAHLACFLPHKSPANTTSHRFQTVWLGMKLFSKEGEINWIEFDSQRKNFHFHTSYWLSCTKTDLSSGDGLEWSGEFERNICNTRDFAEVMLIHMQSDKNERTYFWRMDLLSFTPIDIFQLWLK